MKENMLFLALILHIGYKQDNTNTRGDKQCLKKFSSRNVSDLKESKQSQK